MTCALDDEPRRDAAPPSDLRVLQLTSSARRRGAEVFAHQLGGYLRDRGYGVSTFALERPGDQEHDLPFLTVRHGRFDPRSLLGLVAAARQHDVVLAHGGSTLAPAVVVSTLSRRPLVYRNIGDPAHWGDVRGAGLRIGAPLRRAEAVIALYPEAREYLKIAYSLRDERLATIGNAVDPEGLEPPSDAARTAARSTLGLDSASPVIGYLGSLSTEKRPEWAVGLARRGHQVVIGGDGPLRHSLERQAVELHNSARVHFTGAISDPGSFLSALDVLVLPSRTEGIPGVLIEAALCGVPVVATQVGGVPDTVASLGCGVCTPGDDEHAFARAVDAVLAAPDGHRVPRDVVVQRHGIQSVAGEWARVLSDVVAGRHPDATVR